jgi:tetratricopeptide (TPR) repeat protein
MRINRSALSLNLLIALFASALLHGLAGETHLPGGANTLEFYRAQGTNHFARGEWDKAITDFSECLSLSPTNAEAFAGRGCSYFAKGNLAEAISDLSRQIQLEPTNVIAYLNRGNAHRAKREFDLALLDYNECLQLEPTNLDALGGRVAIYNQQRDFAKAARDLDQAVQLQPDNAVIWVMRGCARNNARQYAGAAEDFQKAMQINPANADACGDLGWLRATCPVAALRDGQAAVALATKACELTQWKRWHCLDTLAAALAETGDFEKAAGYERQVLAMNGISDQDRTAIQSRLSLFDQQKPYREAGE